MYSWLSSNVSRMSTVVPRQNKLKGPFSLTYEKIENIYIYVSWSVFWSRIHFSFFVSDQSINSILKSCGFPKAVHWTRTAPFDTLNFDIALWLCQLYYNPYLLVTYITITIDRGVFSTHFHIGHFHISSQLLSVYFYF